MSRNDYISTNGSLKLDTIFNNIDNHTSQLANNVQQLESININVKFPPLGFIGAKGDGIKDDVLEIQALLDYIFAKGGGELRFPLGDYNITQPLIIKTVMSGGGYNYPKISLVGNGNVKSSIKKTGTNKLYNLDATCILIDGTTLDIANSFSGVEFNNINITNLSTGLLTYAVYGNKGSRLMTNYSSFSTIKDLPTVANHDRYAMYLGTVWCCSFKDCTYGGDYGLFTNSGCTSLLLENLFASTDKIAYRISAIYSTLINTCADFCNGKIYDFYFATLHCVSLGGESANCDTMINLTNSNITVDQVYLNQSNLDIGTVIRGAGSTLKIKMLYVFMQTTSMGYLWTGGIQNNITIEKLILSSAIKFKYSKISTMATDGNKVIIMPDESLPVGGIIPLTKFTTSYWDWYMATPTIPTNNIIMGLKSPTMGSDGTDHQWNSGGTLNGFYVNSSFTEKNVLGWVRHTQSSPVLRDGLNYYVPLIIQGVSANRPTWQTVGMQYFDTTLSKPIWCKTVSATVPVWVDAMGTVV